MTRRNNFINIISEYAESENDISYFDSYFNKPYETDISSMIGEKFIVFKKNNCYNELDYIKRSYKFKNETDMPDNIHEILDENNVFDMFHSTNAFNFMTNLLKCGILHNMDINKRTKIVFRLLHFDAMYFYDIASMIDFELESSKIISSRINEYVNQYYPLRKHMKLNEKIYDLSINMIDLFLNIFVIYDEIINNLFKHKLTNELEIKIDKIYGDMVDQSLINKFNFFNIMFFDDDSFINLMEKYNITLEGIDLNDVYGNTNELPAHLNEKITIRLIKCNCLINLSKEQTFEYLNICLKHKNAELFKYILDNNMNNLEYIKYIMENNANANEIHNRKNHFNVFRFEKIYKDDNGKKMIHYLMDSMRHMEINIISLEDIFNLRHYFFLKDIGFNVIVDFNHDGIINRLNILYEFIFKWNEDAFINFIDALSYTNLGKIKKCLTSVIDKYIHYEKNIKYIIETLKKNNLNYYEFDTSIFDSDKLDTHNNEHTTQKWMYYKFLKDNGFKIIFKYENSDIETLFKNMLLMNNRLCAAMFLEYLIDNNVV